MVHVVFMTSRSTSCSQMNTSSRFNLMYAVGVCLDSVQDAVQDSKASCYLQPSAISYSKLSLSIAIFVLKIYPVPAFKFMMPKAMQLHAMHMTALIAAFARLAIEWHACRARHDQQRQQITHTELTFCCCQLSAA